MSRPDTDDRDPLEGKAVSERRSRAGRYAIANSHRLKLLEQNQSPPEAGMQNNHLHASLLFCKMSNQFLSLLLLFSPGSSCLQTVFCSAQNLWYFVCIPNDTYFRGGKKGESKFRVRFPYPFLPLNKKRGVMNSCRLTLRDYSSRRQNLAHEKASEDEVSVQEKKRL
jgi:hypothetical protein